MTTDGIDRSFGAPRFDVVLRGYDRRQVDEHIARLQRVLSRMRSDLESARRLQGAVPPVMGPPAPPGVRPRPSPRPRPDGMPVGDGGGEGRDVVGTVTERMHAILQAAEEEAAEIRGKAQSAARAEEERVGAARNAARAEQQNMRATLADLVRQRDAVLADLTRVRGQLEGLLAMPTTLINLPAGDRAPDAPEPDADTGQPLPGTAEPSEVVAVPVDEIPDDDVPVEDVAVEEIPVDESPSAETAAAPGDPTAPEPESDSESVPEPESPPRRLRFTGSTLRNHVRPAAAQPVQDSAFDLFRPASEDRLPDLPASGTGDAQSTEGSPVERTAVLRPVVRAPETTDDDRPRGAAHDDPADDTGADVSADEPADGDVQPGPVQQARAARYG
jgi:hypothetical protein